MRELSEEYHELSNTVTNQGAQLSSIGNRVGRLEHEFLDYTKESRNSFHNIERALANLSAHKPMGVMEIFKGIGVIGSAFALLAAGIIYLATGAFETRISLIEYKQEQIIKQQAKQRTSLLNKTDMLGYFPDHAAD